ncbi:eCIS core domain-containing protein [Streptomyces sp. S6]
MRARESRDDARESAAGTAKRSAPRVGGPLGLQPVIGNAAVVQMLRAHRHGAGCGHDEEPAVQRSAVHGVLRGNGRPLDPTVRDDMEGRLGADFSDVRLHTGAEARRSAAEIGARAYTSGNHVVIGDGGGDRHTLAHELTHVIQQRQGPVSGTDNGAGLSVSDPGDRFEREAEANARRVMRGAPSGLGGAGGSSEGAGVVQRMKRTRADAEDAEGQVNADAVNFIAAANEDTYSGGKGWRIAKTPEAAACWEWAVRAAADSGGLDRGEYWDYLISVSQEGDVRELDQLEPAVRADLDRLRGDVTAAGLNFDFDNLDPQHDEATMRPLMEEAVRTFVRAHGFQIAGADPAGWIVCHYKMDGSFGVPEHFWIELPTPSGDRVLLQTVPDIPYIEAGKPNLRWHDPGSIPERAHEQEAYVTIEVPVAALKGAHSAIINGVVERVRRTRRKAGESSSAR